MGDHDRTTASRLPTSFRVPSPRTSGDRSDGEAEELAALRRGDESAFKVLVRRLHKELIEDFKQNRAGDAVRVCGEYLDYIAADRDYAAELAASESPAWVVHVEKNGDGGLTDAERATLEAADTVTLVTFPGSVFLLPDEAPDQTAAVIATALSTLD